MARRHQIAPAVFPDPHQILGRFLIDDRDRRRGDLVQTQQPGQMQSVTGIGLDSVPSGFVQLRRADLTPDPAAMSPWSTHSAASMNDVDIDRVPGARHHSTDGGRRAPTQASSRQVVRHSISSSLFL